MDSSLSHLKIVELCEDLPGSYCAEQFAAWGAEVVTVEPPGGSALRRAEPIVTGANGKTVSLLWEYVNAGKRSLEMDFAGAFSLRRFKSLLDRSDVFITDWSLERLENAGLDLKVLSGSSPELIILSLTPFGADGPYSHFQVTDLVLQALSGLMSVNGSAEAEPLKAPANIVPYACGVNAFIGAMAAIINRGSSGAGQLIEVACLEAVASLVPYLRTEYSGNRDVRLGGQASGAVMFTFRDGHVSLSPHYEAGWSGLLAALEIDEANIPEPLRTPEGREDWASVRTFIAEHTKNRSAIDLYHTLNGSGAACGIALGPSELLQDVNLESLGYFKEVKHPGLGSMIFPGPAARMSQTPMAPPSPAPEMGDLHADQDKFNRRAHSESVSQAPPLQGIRIVDLTQAWLGPYATMLLADLGAEVVKIETLKRPDGWRGRGGRGRPSRVLSKWSSHPTNPKAHPQNVNANFNSVNRNKRSVGLDLKSAKGKELFLRLVGEADLVTENFTPHVMDRLGLGYEELRRVKPDVILVSNSGYGKTGPYQDYRANGASTEATGGWCSQFGYPGGPPLAMGAMYADPITGLQMAASALVALIHRNRTGKGQYVEGSMFEAAVGYIGEEILLASANGQEAQRRGNRHRQMSPHGVFPCLGDDRWVAICVRNDDDWVSLLSVLADSAALRDARFRTTEGRLAFVEYLEELLRQWTSAHTAREIMTLLQGAGVPAGEVQPTDEVLQDAHFAARHWFKPIEHPDLGIHRYNGFPWRFSRTHPEICLPPPRLGEHSAEVLKNELHLTSEEIETLVEQGVTGSILEKVPEESPAN